MTGLPLKFVKGFLSEVKRRAPKVKRVLGGPHVTSIPADSVKEPIVDFVVVGDGETSFYNLVKCIEEKGNYKAVKGIYFKDKLGNPIANPPEEFEDLEKLGELPLHLVDMEKYISNVGKRRRLVVFSSRGCPFGCAYCYNSNKYNRRRWRCISSKKMYNFIRMLMRKYNVSYFVFQDDNFWVNRKRVDEFVSLIEKDNLNIKWAVHGATLENLKYVTPEIALRLKKSGLMKVLFGIESVSPKIQKIIGKKIESRDIYLVDKIITSAGIKIIYSFMCGFPDETDEDIKMNIKVMMKIRKQSPHNDMGNIKPVIYFPGTRLYYWALKNGLKPPKTLDEWSNYTWGNYESLDYPWISKERKRFFQDLYFATMLLNPDYTYLNNPVWKYISKMLYPFTKWRVKNLYFKYSPVLFMVNLLKKTNLL